MNRNKTTDTNQASGDEKLAKLFHDTYERLAPAFSYKTRKASAVPWADVPPNNKGLMIAVAHEVNDAIRTEKLKLLDEVIHQSTVNLKSAKAVAGWAILRKEQLEAEL